MHIAYSDKLSLGSDEWISLSKPIEVFKRCFDAQHDTVIQFAPIRLDQVILAHERLWATEVFECYLENGFCDKRPEVMEQVRYANGAILAGAETALTTGVCFAPVSGFHHAGYDYNGSFCTFNGLVIALQSLKRANKIKTALILDFDGHYGDGTDHIIGMLDLNWITHMTRRKPFNEPQASIAQAVVAIQTKPDIVIYQAGADSHIDDSFGVGYFDDQAWIKRDELIFKTCQYHGVPIVWNLAGGYSGGKTFDLHASTFMTACEVFEPNRNVRNGTR